MMLYQAEDRKMCKMPLRENNSSGQSGRLRVPAACQVHPLDYGFRVDLASTI
jgi:hypothetical protein